MSNYKTPNKIFIQTENGGKIEKRHPFIKQKTCYFNQRVVHYEVLFRINAQNGFSYMLLLKTLLR